MRFLTNDECAAWAEAHGHGGTTAARELPRIEVRLPSQPSYFAFCRAIAEAIEPRSSCLLWIVQHGIWPSSENWHLYYRLRHSYGDQRLLHEAPGHLFLDYESPDLVSFLQIALACGWDANVFPRLLYGDAGSARVFISHDEFIVLAHRDQTIIEKWQTLFESWLKE